MMIRPATLRNLGADTSGSVIVEFAILAPVLLAMFLGVLTMGLHTWSSNALNAVAADTARYTLVEYQKDNKPTNKEIESRAYGIAVNPPYGLDFDRLEVAVSRPATDISGTIRFQLDMDYTPYNPLEFTGVHAPAISATRYFYVAQ